MKKNIVFLAPIALIVLSVLIFSFSIFNDERFNALEWVAAICGFLAIAWIAAMLLNVALFAPVFCLLGKLQSKRDKKEAGHEHDD